MSLSYQTNGNLSEGIHEINWQEFVKEFGYNSHRLELIKGLSQALSDLKSCGCNKVYVDGSFTTKKILPNDIDVCWDPTGVDFKILYSTHPVFFDFKNFRQNQKLKYKCEFFPTTAVAKPNPREAYVDFFRHDKDDNPKGIILLRI